MNAHSDFWKPDCAGGGALNIENPTVEEPAPIQELCPHCEGKGWVMPKWAEAQASLLREKALLSHERNLRAQELHQVGLTNKHIEREEQ